LTPCSTGSNSSERLSDATANMMESGTEETWKYEKKNKILKYRKKYIELVFFI
jgi:hypothetical protein